MEFLTVCAHVALVWSILWFLAMPWLIYRTIIGIVAEKYRERKDG